MARHKVQKKREGQTSQAQSTNGFLGACLHLCVFAPARTLMRSAIDLIHSHH
jgi:hypothetical protein